VLLHVAGLEKQKVNNVPQTMALKFAKNCTNWFTAFNEVGSETKHRPRCKKKFLRFLFWSRFLTFFIFKNVGKVQSGKQVNKKHFQNNNNEIYL